MKPVIPDYDWIIFGVRVTLAIAGVSHANSAIYMLFSTPRFTYQTDNPVRHQAESVGILSLKR